LTALAEHHFGGGGDYCRGCVQVHGQACPACPYDHDAPRTEEGHACWQSACAALRAGPAGAEIDMSAALAFATVQGAPAPAAAPLLHAIATGLAMAQAKRREAEKS
jgi:hypothetical protein